MIFLKFNKVTISLLLLVGAIVVGAVGFWSIDHYPPIDAFYMSVITITTVGFGEIYPLSEWGRLFAAIYILVGFVVLGFVGHSIIESLLEKVWSGNVLEKKMKKQISLLKNHYIICGFGRVGEVATKHLQEAGAEFVVIEKSEKDRELCKNMGWLCVEGDATRESVLLEAGIKNASGLLAMVNSDPLNLFIVLTARELNPTLHIIARSEEKHTATKILRAGADSIISPFDSAGQQIASDLLAATTKNHETVAAKESETLSVPVMINVNQESGLIGQSLREASQTYKILGLRSNGVDYIQPDEETCLQQGDQILVIKKAIGGSEHRPVPPKKKIVIIDDSPVIVRLFSRLFQKEGYHPFSCDTGEAGFELIQAEKPSVAVIDYMLPGMSGLDLCRKIQDSNLDENLKLVVFTAENDLEVRQQCLDAGADSVIVKSADAGEIIKTVSTLIK